MATARAVMQRCARMRSLPFLSHSVRAAPVAGVTNSAFQGLEQQVGRASASAPEDDAGRNGSRWMAAGAYSLSFAASVVSVAAAKECVADKFAPGEVVLYQYDACPFCNKVKAFLDYHDIAYKVVEVNPMGKKELKWSNYKKVPVLVVDGEQMNDSTAIITELTRRIEGGNANVLVHAPAFEEEEKWRSWVDEHLVHLLSPNIYRTPAEALQAFDYLTTSGNFSTMERFSGKYFGAAAMYVIGKRLKKRLNIVDERQALFDAAEEWVSALDGQHFMGGSKPNLADLAVFGVLRPIRHLDTGRDMLASTKIGEWYARMVDAVGATARLQEEPLMVTIDNSMKV